ncbi:hypothetical protein BDZ89DRAFT_360850 [Hymenopellis radicata]|nr:hypothetical protein BDZ89DRAFT_360850 [Hymenopellis radicata]
MHHHLLVRSFTVESTRGGREMWGKRQGGVDFPAQAKGSHPHIDDMSFAYCLMHPRVCYASVPPSPRPLPRMAASRNLCRSQVLCDYARDNIYWRTTTRSPQRRCERERTCSVVKNLTALTASVIGMFPHGERSVSDRPAATLWTKQMAFLSLVATFFFCRIFSTPLPPLLSSL